MSFPMSTQGVPVIPVWFGVRTAAFSVIIMPLIINAPAAQFSVMVGSLFDPVSVFVLSSGSLTSIPVVEMAKPTKSSTCPP